LVALAKKSSGHEASASGLRSNAPKHALAEIRADFHRIVYVESLAAARGAVAAFEWKWRTRCPGVVRSFHEGGDELLTFFSFPKAWWTRAMLGTT
jgi:transposase-like protein